MTNDGVAPPEPSLAENPPKREKIGFLAPASIILFIALTLVGTYYARRHILERHMVSAMAMNDDAMMMELARAFPSPVNVHGTYGRHQTFLIMTQGSLRRSRSVGYAWAAEGGTPLHWAAGKGNREVAELLIAKGAGVNARDASGQTPLHSADAYGRKEFIALLLASGAEINARDNLGWTPLHVAAICGYKDVVECLIARGADINAQDRFGKTPLGSAVVGEHDDVAELLRSAGAKE